MNTIFGNQEFKPLMRFQTLVPGYYISEKCDMYSAKSRKIIKARKKFSFNRDAPPRLKEMAYNVSIPKDLLDDYDYSTRGRMSKSRELYISAHRAVMETWKPIDEFPPIPKEDWDKCPESAKQWIRDTAFVDHIDDDPSNNNLNNLQWVIPKDNQPHRKKHNNR